MFNTAEGQRILRFGGIALIVLIVFLAVQVLYTLRLTAHIDESTPAMKMITVNGKGEVLVVPDIATFSFGAEETAVTVADAQKLVTDKINKGIDMVKAAGVDEKDIKTVGYNIYPNYQYTQSVCTQFSCPPSRQVIDGYRVSQTVEVKVRDTSKAGTILGQLGSIQLNNISGLNFTVDDEEAAMAEAKEMAIADAREQAKMLAKNLDVRLGKVISFGEDRGYTPYASYSKEVMMMDSAAGASTPEVPGGQNTITSYVYVTYEIK